MTDDPNARRRYFFDHPVKAPKGMPKRRLTVTANAAEAAAYKQHLANIRSDLRMGLRTPEQVREMFNAAKVEQEPLPVSRLVFLYVDPPGRISPATAAIASGWLAGYGRELAGRDARALDARTVAQWIRRMYARGLSPTTVKRAWAMLSTFVRHGLELGELKECPWSTWRPRLVPSREVNQREAVRNLGELAQLFEAARAIDAAQRWPSGRPRALERARHKWSIEARIMTAVAMGLGQGELAGLRWSDLQPTRGEIVIARQYDGEPLKRLRRAGPLRVPPELFARLEAHREELKYWRVLKPDGPIFPDPKRSADYLPRHYKRADPAHVDQRGQVITTDEIRAVVRAAGLPNPGAWIMGSLRHSYATLEAQARRGDWVALAERMRHAGGATSAHYLHASTREAAEPGFALSPPAPPVPRLPEGGSSQ